MVILNRESFRSEAEIENPGLVIYTMNEVEELIRKNPSDSEILFIHKAKQVVNGSIMHEGR